MTLINTLETSGWQYLLGKPISTAKFKSQLADFQVTEELGYPLTEDGEHLYLWVRKQGANTAFVAEQIAKQFRLPLRQVTYAGRKDKFSLAEQWFALHIPGKSLDNLEDFNLEGVEILRAVRHNKKLRVGALQGNHFNIRLRDVTDKLELEERLTHVAEQGVPNYYGEQRFGNQNGNLLLGQRMSEGEEIRNRNKRSMAISALRSWLFNEQISQRIQQGLFRTILAGDAMILSGSNSFFVVDEAEQGLDDRMAHGDILLSAGLFGKGEGLTCSASRDFEDSVFVDYSKICETLAQVGLKQERRAISLHPKNMQWEWLNEQDIQIGFSLPSGCFATSVLRELVDYSTEVEGAG
jgi:tRNA pseudouridine13 synthase